ncbi:hypothetical protein BDY24DRAFT_399522 [Mrakia frigida]|uniref:uncharacterized protein n=1 Tax=Mrakia frigida TaxID=29902 RepID=UPI003FCC0C91
MTTAPLPPSGSFIASVRSSCEASTKKAGIEMTPSSMTSFLLSLPHSTYTRLSLEHGTSSFPLNFPSPLSELNLLSLLALLNFGSSFRAPLHAFHQRGVYDTIRFFVLGLFLSSTDSDDLLSAKRMSEIGEGQVAGLMGGLPLMVEREHETMKGIVVGEKGGRLSELVGMVTGVLNETGRILLEGGWENLGEFVKEVLEEANEKTNDDAAASELFVERLVTKFPAFQDMQMVDGEPVYLFKKAMILLHTLSLRYPSSSTSTPQPFPVPSTSSFLPIFSDNVIPTLLLHLSLFTLPASSSLSQKFPPIPPASSNPLLSPTGPSEPNASVSAQEGPKSSSPLGGPVLNLEETTVLRAAAVYAMQRTVEFVREGGMDGVEGCEWMKEEVNETGLDGCVWTGGKERKDWRRVERFVGDSKFF